MLKDFEIGLLGFFRTLHNSQPAGYLTRPPKVVDILMVSNRGYATDFKLG